MIALVHIRETYELANCTRLGSAVQLKNHGKEDGTERAYALNEDREQKCCWDRRINLLVYVACIIDVGLSLNFLERLLIEL
jgi:hypothetical protein